MRDVGGYTEGEIDALQETPAWVGRLAAAGTVPRELRAERAFALESLELERLTSRCLMLVGSQSPNWALRSTEAYAASMADARVSRLEGQGHGAMLAAPELVARRLREAL